MCSDNLYSDKSNYLPKHTLPLAVELTASQQAPNLYNYIYSQGFCTLVLSLYVVTVHRGHKQECCFQAISSIKLDGKSIPCHHQCYIDLAKKFMETLEIPPQRVNNKLNTVCCAL